MCGFLAFLFQQQTLKVYFFFHKHKRNTTSPTTYFVLFDTTDDPFFAEAAATDDAGKRKMKSGFFSLFCETIAMWDRQNKDSCENRAWRVWLLKCRMSSKLFSMSGDGPSNFKFEMLFPGVEEGNRSSFWIFRIRMCQNACGILANESPRAQERLCQLCSIRWWGAQKSSVSITNFVKWIHFPSIPHGRWIRHIFFSFDSSKENAPM